MKDLVLALDFGGTKLAAAVIDLGTEKIIGPVIQQPTPVTEGAGGTLQAMIHCGEQALAVLGITNGGGQTGQHSLHISGARRR